MQTYQGLYIPPKANDAPPRSQCVARNITDIQHVVFCHRADKDECSNIPCYPCLFYKDNLPQFIKWYRDRKLIILRRGNI